MISPKATGSESKGQHNVTNAFQFGSKPPPRPRSICFGSRGILPENNSRANRINNPDELTAKALDLADIGASGDCVLLAWIAANDGIDGPFPRVARWERSNVGVTSCSWPVLRENSSCIVIDFNLPITLPASSVQSQIQTTDSGKQAPVFHLCIELRVRSQLSFVRSLPPTDKSFR